MTESRAVTGPASAGPDPGPALDAHVHVWDLAVRPQPWTGGLPALQRSFGLDDVAADLRAADQLRAAQAGRGGQALVGVRHQLQEEPDTEWLARPRSGPGCARWP